MDMVSLKLLLSAILLKFNTAFKHKSADEDNKFEVYVFKIPVNKSYVTTGCSVCSGIVTYYSILIHCNKLYISYNNIA